MHACATRAYMGAYMGVNMRANMGANMHAYMGANMGAIMRAYMGVNMRAYMGANMGANMRAYMGANMRAYMGANMGANMGAYIHACVCYTHASGPPCRLWAVGLTSGNTEGGWEHNSTWAAFSISIVLTEEGLAHIFEVNTQMFMIFRQFFGVKYLKISEPCKAECLVKTTFFNLDYIF